MSCFAENLSELKYILLTKYPLANDSTSRAFSFYGNKFTLRQSIEKIGCHNSRVS